MRKGAIRVAAICLAGTVSLAGNSIISNAALTEMPLAGMTVTIEDLENVATNTNAEVVNNTSPNVKSEYENIAIAQVDDYVNIRDAASTEGSVLGKLYNNSAATILGEENGWYIIKSGTVTGYVKSEYFITGAAAEELSKEIYNVVAEVATTTLNVRESADENSDILALVGESTKLNVIGEEEGWYQVTLDSDVVGYISKDYAKAETKFIEAESKEEEDARIAREEADRLAKEAALAAALEEARRADEAAAAAANVIETTPETAGAVEGIGTQETERQETETPFVETEAPVVTETEAYVPETEAPVQVDTSSGTRASIVAFALQFQGNPYVWGGTSLTNGADCSGFTQSVLANFGIYIPRVAQAQAYSGGSQVSLDSIQPGDLLFYGSASNITHVAMYIGNGQIIHASDSTTGIIVSNYNYRQPVCATSYIY